jgi:hypothetical protein
MLHKREGGRMWEETEADDEDWLLCDPHKVETLEHTCLLSLFPLMLKK